MTPQNFDLTRIGDIGDGIIDILNDLREHERVLWHEPAQAWLVLHHDDVAAGFRGDLPLSNKTAESRVFAAASAEEMATRFPRLLKSAPRWVISMDPPEHGKLRNLLVMNAFRPAIIERMRPFVQNMAEELLDEIEASPEIEFVEHAARRITGRVILTLLGVPLMHEPRLKGWADALVAGAAAAAPTLETLEATETAMREMEEVFLVEIAKRRAQPTGDFLSELINTNDKGVQLTDDDIVAQLYLLLIAGHESTTNTIAMIVAALLQDDEARADFLSRTDDPSKALGPILEMMRFVAMAAAMPRVAAIDFELHGKQIKQGQNVFLMIASANRDPSVFAHPEQIDFDRPNDKMMTFGPGIHHCLGHQLAKLESNEFVPRFLRRFPNSRLLEHDLAFTPGLFFRGIEAMPMALR